MQFIVELAGKKEKFSHAKTQRKQNQSTEQMSRPEAKSWGLEDPVMANGLTHSSKTRRQEFRTNGELELRSPHNLGPLKGGSRKKKSTQPHRETTKSLS